MCEVQTLASKSGTANVDHWQKRRLILVRDNRVFLQITLRDCNHCSICERRVTQIQSILATKKYTEHVWEYLPEFGDRRFVSLPVKPQQNSIGVLQEVLNLQITGLSWD